MSDYGSEAWNLQDLEDNLPTLDTWSSSSDPAGSSSQSGEKGGHGGVQSYTSILGYCNEEGRFGLVAADTRVSKDNITLSDKAGKVVTISDNIVMVGSGNEPIYTALKECLRDFTCEDAMASTMEDVVECITKLTQDCVDENMKANPGDSHVVYYIIIGKMANTVEMYTIGNAAQDIGTVIFSKEYGRIVNGGSGKGPLDQYQIKNPIEHDEEFEAVGYFFRCMREALKLDERSSGDIIMYSINNDDDEGLKLHAFPESEVYGHAVEIDKNKARSLVNK